MKKGNFKLTQARLRALLHYDQQTGIFTWRAAARTGNHDAFLLHEAGDIAGSPAGHDYIRIGIDGERHYGHRLAWLYMTGEWPAIETDHRDANKMNNAWANLRAATSSFNKQNIRTPHTNNKSGFIGVSWDATRKLWTARIRAQGHYKYLGHFDSAERASRAYITAKRQLHEGCTI